ncbi:hypothetical protein DMB95_00185 [Campylobacter sp. MIT 12-8780]|uniref:putative barnase/colicin E5 family endoribonuclease n=1 Tax=Campylobacter sp. MIT 12-8780 TaxID=2202200 RepID=UPI00115C6E09|nr:hypothetical protein [Campylobacter sp. MIT 12-8780]TQR42954.1 hypothetical protein DMB95_00185 [Campylobacter sp. MIT 12-8780]
MSVQNSINLSPKTLQGELANQPLNPPALKNQALSTPALQTPALNEEQNTEQNEEQSDLASLHPASQEQANTPQEQTNPDEKPALLLAFDFDKALNAGFSKEEIMKHLQSKQSEINWEDLNKKSVDEGFEMLKKQGFQTPNFKTYARAENEEEKAALSWLNPANFNAAKLKHEEAKARKNEVDTQNADLKAQVASIVKEKQDENPLFKAGKELFNAVLGVDFDEDKKKKLDAYTSALIAANVPFEALDEDTKALLAWQKTQNDASDLFSLHRFDEGLSENLKQSFSQKDEAKLLQEAALKQFNHLKTLNEAYQKNAFEDLSEAEKAAIDKERGLFSSIWDKTGHQLFGDDEERFLDEKKDFEARFAVSDELRSAVVRLGENSSYKGLIIGGKNEKDKADFERDFKRVAEFAGFDEALVDEGSGELYVKKGEHIYRVNNNFGANFLSFIEANQLSLGGSLAGAWLGFQKGKGLKDAARKSIAGAAAGSMLGKIGDVALTNYAYDKEHKLDEYLALATQEGILSLVGDAVIVNAKPLFKSVATSVSKAVEYVPVLNFTKSIPTQNFKAAKDLVAQSVDEGTRAQLQSFYKEFGGDLQAKQGKTLGEFANFLAQRYGSDHALTKHTQKLSEILNLNSLTTRQQELFKAIRADESGFLLPYIKEVASLDSKANESLKGILNATTARLESSLNALNINKSDIKTLLDELHKGTKEDFARVSDAIINKLYDDKTYTTTLDKTKFEALKNELESTGALGENELLFLKDIQKNVFDEKGVSFKQLNNARINLNEFLRKASTPSSKNFFKSEAINTLKDEIAKGINQIFSQNKTAYTKVSALYNTALQEYAQMSELLKQSAFKKARDEKQSLDEALDSLIKYAKGQGDGKNNNLDFLRSKLDAPNTAILEMNLLKRFFEKSLASTDESLRVLDSAKFMNELAKLQNFTFQSKEAKEFIKLSQGFHTLFKNDASLAEDLLSKTARKEGSALATSISGAYAQKLVKGLFDFTFRNLPQSFMFGFFKNSIQGAALRHHLRHALQKSVSVDEFNHTLKHSLSKSQFNSQTRKLADELMSELEQTSKALDEEARLMSKSLEEKRGQKEARGLYNVVYNDKFSTQIKKDLQSADYLATLSKGFHFKRGGKGARHIKLEHTIDSTQEGFVTPQEVASLGVKMREFLQKHKEPFLSDQGGKKAFIYEWQDEKGVRFRLVSTANATELQPAPPSTKEELTDEIITFYSDRNLKEPMSFKNPALQENKELKSQAQNPQKNLSLFEKALLEKEELIASKKAEALRQEKEAKEQLKRLEAQQQALRAQKDARAGLGVNENVSFTQGASIHATPLKDTTIIIDDESLPLKATYMVIDKKDIKPSFERAGVQGRSTKQDAVIKNIQEDFKPSLIFDKEGSFDGVPIITKDGQVVVGNHRSEAMNALNKEARKAYEKAVEAKFNIKLKDNEIIVRKLDENTDTKDILRLAFASNAGRESNFGEKALANLARFEKDIENLPNFLNASSVDEMSFLIAKHLDKQGKGLDSFNANLALFANLAKNSKNNDILEGLNEALKHLDAQSKNKILKMYVENAGAFYNIAKDTDLKELDLRNFLADAFVASAKANQTRSEDFKALLESLEHYTSLTAEARKQFDELHPNFTQDIKAQALGLALARFARLENPSASLFEFLHSAKSKLEELIAPNLFDPNGKSLSEANMNDFLKLILAEGQENKDKPALLNALTKLDELETAKRAVSFEDLSKLNEDFGTNYAEFYHKPIEAFHKLKSEQSGQVAGAFERKDLGDIDLVWGEVWRDEKGQIQGFGLSKILQKHPEITAELLADIVENGSLKKQVNEAMQVIKDNYKIVLKSNWKGKPSNKWIVTAYEVEEKGSSISSKPLTKGDNLPLNSSANSTTKELKSQAKLTDSKEYNELINDFINRHPTPLRHTREEIYPKDILNDETLYKEYTEDLQRYIDRELERNFMSKQARIDTMELRTLQVLKQLKEGKPLNPLLRDDEILDLGISLFQVRQMQEELAQKGFHIELAPEVKARLELADQGYEDALYYPSKHTLEVQAHKAEQKQAQDLTHSKDMLKNSQNFNISSALKDLPAENTPLKLDEKELDELLQRFDNVENIKEHLSTRADSEQRKALFNLLDSTLENPHFQYIKDGKDKFLKKFKSSGKEPFFYLLITKDGNKNFITHLKTRDYAYLEKELNKADELVKGADIIEGLRQQAGASKEAINPQPPKANSTTNKTLSQDEQIDFEDLTHSKDMLKNSQNFNISQEFSIIDKEQAKELLKNIKPTPAPQYLSKEEFLEKGLSKFINKENFIKNLENSEDTKRLSYLNLADETYKNYDLKLMGKGESGEERQTFIKAFSYDEDKLFYMLVSEEQNKLLITGIPTKKAREVIKRIENAQSIEARDFEGISSAPSLWQSQTSKSQPSTTEMNSTTKELLSQDNKPNELHSNTHLGSGLFTGSVAGIEEDEQGNLSFDPAQFVAGFLGGAGASKLMSSKVVQDRALTFVKNISKEYENLSAQKPKLFATILQKMDIKTMIGNTDKAKEQARKLFNEELFKRVKNAIDNDEITIMPKSEFKNEEEFKALFDRIDGKFGYIDTPYKSVKVNTHYAFTHFRKNTYDTNRENIKGGFFESFKEPLFVVEHKRDGASEPSVYFYKPFYDKEKQLLNLFGIGVNERGFLNFKTYYLDKQGSRLKSLMKDRNLIIKYMK